MKSYPSIPHILDFHLGKPYIAFDKLDGSNIRIEFNHKTGFTKFGTRNMLISDDSDFKIGKEIFMNKYSEDLSKLFFTKDFRNYKTITVYAELIGEDSFAGFHNFNKDLNLVIFDAWLYKKGFLEPNEFIKQFEKFETPKIISKGVLDSDFIKSIKENTDLSEGVICKGVHNKNVWQCKIKTLKWLKRLKNKFGEQALMDEFNSNEYISSNYKF